MAKGEATWGSLEVPAEVIASWAPKKKYIAAGELIMVPILQTQPFLQQAIRNQQAVWFLDNMGSWGSLIKATASTEDLAQLAMLAQVGFTALATDTYYEWVRSAANIADAPSRGKVPQVPPSVRTKEVQLLVPWQVFLNPLEEARRLLLDITGGT